MTDPGHGAAPAGRTGADTTNEPTEGAATTPSPSLPGDAAEACCTGAATCDAACDRCGGPGRRPTTRRHCTQRHQAEVVEQLRRRRDAGFRLEPLPDGRRDPWLGRLAEAIRSGPQTRLAARLAAAAAVMPPRCSLPHPHDLARCPR
jgi:hypothetical protein